MRRAAIAIAALVAVSLLTGDAPANKSSTFASYVEAARMLREWRYDEAAEAIAGLARTHPRADETRYLQAEIAFLEGRYPAALEHLEGLDDDDVAGNVGSLRALVTSTYGVTRDYASRESAGGHFVIYYPPGKDEVIVDLTGDVLEAAYAALKDDFGWAPTEKVRVELLSSPKELARVSTLTEAEIETTGTIALCKYGKLMVVSPRATLFGYPWMDTMVHEYVHYVVSRVSHDSVPVWLHEGLARYQQERWRGPARGALSAVDRHLLAKALAGNALITFDEMHPSMAKLPSAEAAALAFAEVHTMVAYLHGQVGYEGLRKVFELTRDGKSAQRAVAEVLDRRWSEVERDWKAYLRGLDLETNDALAGRATAQRIRFDKGGEDDDNVGVDEVASERARKHARLGGILRARGMSEAAAIQYEKALAITGPGDPFVAAKLSRTYLELERYDRAIELAEPLAKADENDAAPATTLGVAYLALERPGDARTAFEAALRISPFDPAVRCGLAEAYAAGGAAKLAERERTACTKLR
jgi:tetratricopeptide (TPR) repeat protein